MIQFNKLVQYYKVIWLGFGIALSIFEWYANYKDLKTRSVLIEEIDIFKWKYIWRNLNYLIKFTNNKYIDMTINYWHIFYLL